MVGYSNDFLRRGKINASLKVTGTTPFLRDEFIAAKTQPHVTSMEAFTKQEGFGV